MTFAVDWALRYIKNQSTVTAMQSECQATVNRRCEVGAATAKTESGSFFFVVDSSEDVCVKVCMRL